MTYLIKKGATINRKCYEGNTAMHMALSPKLGSESEKDINDQCEIVRLLVSYGGDLDVLNNVCQTPIAFARFGLLQRLHLGEGKATYLNKESQKESNSRHFNRDLYLQDCNFKTPTPCLSYQFKRCSSASTMSSFPTMEAYKQSDYDDVYTRRARYLQTDEYKLIQAELESRNK